jgi:hypothetical protein
MGSHERSQAGRNSECHEKIWAGQQLGELIVKPLPSLMALALGAVRLLHERGT